MCGYINWKAIVLVRSQQERDGTLKKSHGREVNEGTFTKLRVRVKRN